MTLAACLLLSLAAFAAEPAPKAGAEAPQAARHLRARLHKEASRWTPLSVKAGEDPKRVRTTFQLKVQILMSRGKEVRRGQPTTLSAQARLHRIKDDQLLVISLHPRALRRSRKHLEVRLLLVEGYLEEAKAAVVTVTGGDIRSDDDLDFMGLRENGVSYLEEFPARGVLELSALDPYPGKLSLNAGELSAEFGDKEIGSVDCSYSLRGVSGAKP